MNSFPSTAFRYLKGQSGLPSTLPGRPSVNLAREESRKVRNLCKGLECFREVLYDEPVVSRSFFSILDVVGTDRDKDECPTSVAMMQNPNLMGSTSAVKTVMADQGPVTPAAVKQDQDSLGSNDTVNSNVEGQESIAFAVEQDQNPPGAASPVSEVTADQAPISFPDTTQDQELDSSAKAAAEVVADQKPRKYVLTTDGDLFQSLFAVKKTPSTSPGSAASSSTLVDPSSRKVSPSDLEFRANGSPGAVKDSANESSDSKHERDSMAVIEETTKKELLKQLKKMTAAEKKAMRKVAKLMTRNETLSAELKTAKAELQNKDVQIDLAKTLANASKLSNVVLRQALQDLRLKISREKTGAGVQEATADPTTVNLEETTPDQDGLNRSSGKDKILKADGDFPYPPLLMTDDPVAGSDSDADFPAQEPITKEISNQHQAQGVICGLEGGVHANYEFSEAAGPATLWGILQSDQREETVDASEEAGPAILWGILQSAQREEEAIVKGDVDEKTTNVPESTGPPSLQSNQCGDEEKVEIKAGEKVVDASEETGPAILWGILRSDQREVEIEVGAVARQETADASEVEGQECADDEAIGASEMEGQECADDEAIGASEADGQEGAGGETADLSEAEAPGPATLWGILKSDCEISRSDSIEELGESAEASEFTVLEEPEGSVSAGVEDQDDSLLPDSHAPETNRDFDPLYDVSDEEEEAVDPAAPINTHTVAEDFDPLYDVSDDGKWAVDQASTASPHPVANDPIPSPHCSVDGDDEVIVEHSVEAIGAAKLDDTVETLTEPIGHAKSVGKDDHQAENHAMGSVLLHETMVSFDTNTQANAGEHVNGFGSDPTAGLKEDWKEELQQATRTANASTVGLVSVELQDEWVREAAELTQGNVIPRVHPVPDATSGEERGREEGQVREGSAVFADLKITCEDLYEKEKEMSQHGTVEASSVTQDGNGVATSGVTCAQLFSALPCTSPSPPRAYYLPPPETFDYIPPMQKQIGPTKCQRRRAERKRAAAKKKEEEVARRRQEEEEARSPEGLARRQAEEDAKLGDRRLNLQALRMKRQEEVGSLRALKIGR